VSSFHSSTAPKAHLRVRRQLLGTMAVRDSTSKLAEVGQKLYETSE
jgi:hypothetical protein